jgi:hypothetical protein
MAEGSALDAHIIVVPEFRFVVVISALGAHTQVSGNIHFLALHDFLSVPQDIRMQRFLLVIRGARDSLRLKGYLLESLYL